MRTPLPGEIVFIMKWVPGNKTMQATKFGFTVLGYTAWRKQIHVVLATFSRRYDKDSSMGKSKIIATLWKPLTRISAHKPKRDFLKNLKSLFKWNNSPSYCLRQTLVRKGLDKFKNDPTKQRYTTQNIYEHYDDVIMGWMASQITSLTIVYSTVFWDADQRKRQSSASLAFVRRIHRGPVNSPHRWPVTRKLFPFDDVIMQCKQNYKSHHHRLSWWIGSSMTTKFS